MVSSAGRPVGLSLVCSLLLRPGEVVMLQR
jgi:hypothetical protein